MALSSIFLAEIQKVGPQLDLWLEVEGLPWAFGLRDRDASWFAARRDCLRRDVTLGTLIEIPAGVEQELRPYEAESSIGQLTVSLLDDELGAARGLWANAARTDNWGRLTYDLPKPSGWASAVDTPYVTSGLSGTVGATFTVNIANGFFIHDVMPPSGNMIGNEFVFAAGGRFKILSVASSSQASVEVTATLSAAVLAGLAVVGGTLKGGADWWYEPETIGVTLPAGAVVGTRLYVGRETMEILELVSAGVVRVRRGLFRPPAAMELNAYQHTAGDVVTLYPRFGRTRRVWLYSAPTGATDAAKVARWAGTIQSQALRKGLGGVDLTIQSLEASLDAQCFSGQIRGKLAVGVVAPDGSYDRDEAEAVPFADRLRLEPSSISGRTWVDGQRVTVRVGDELVSGRLSFYTNEVVFDSSDANDARGLWGTPAAGHKPGEDVTEVILAVRYAPGGDFEERISSFDQGDNPISLFLQVLLSVAGDGTNGSYDVLPAGWGLGMDQARVDVAGIEAMRDRWATFPREVRVIDAPFKAREFIASVLRSHLCYPVTLLDDQLSIRFLGPPMPDAAPRAISGTVVLSPPSWTDLGETDNTVIGRAIVRCDQDPIDAVWRQTFKAEFQGPGVEAQEFYAGQFDAPEFEWPGQWTGNDPGAAKFGARICTDAETSALRFFDLLRDRRSRPFPAIELQCSYDELDLVSGDLVAVTLANLPDVETGSSAMVGAFCEVRRKTIDDRSGMVTLTLVQVPYGFQHRFVAPSGIVAAGVTSATITLSAHVFTISSGSADDASCFPVGAVVRVTSPDLNTLRGSRTVLANSGGQLQLSASITVSAGDVVTLDAWSTQPTAVTGYFAFLAGSTGTISGEPAHEFTP